VIVTGGGSGIGRCTAHELAALGASVVLVGRNPEKLEKVREEIIHDELPGTMSVTFATKRALYRPSKPYWRRMAGLMDL
jgi:NADP-dependent 3-hydroxy acid dehydrogenase YdfG